MATIAAKLEQTLARYRDRLRLLVWLRGAAMLTAVILAISATAAFLTIRAGFSTDTVITGRLVLLLGIIVVTVLMLVRPLRRLAGNLAGMIESRTRAFNGRVETYLGLGDQPHPLRDLLAEDTLKLAEQHGPGQLVDRRELLVPAAIGTACIVALLWLVIAGPGLLNYGVRHLWAGWAFANLLPPQTISVTPGDEAIRRGGTVKLVAQMNGFEPTGASIHVRMGEQDWQEVEMFKAGRGYEFTFFSVREDADYYVTAAGIRSPDYNIQVVDLPDIESLRLTYNYPEWARRAPETVEPGGDIQAVAGTNIAMEMITDAPLPSGVLVLNGEGHDLDITERRGTGDFDIEQDGQYYIAARLGNELVRLSEDYFIRVLEDGKPDIRFNRPGRDWSASPIEEVTLNIEASDDYALETLELRYSINGGEWQSVPVSVDGRQVDTDHTFFLEDMQGVATRGEQAGLPVALEPGDLVSYYARATDRDQTTNTDIYFIQVQPFDRRYSQSQQAGGGAGGQGGSQQEISQRQKEIIVSTWNLIREKNEASATVNDSTADNALLLSGLQTTLSEQARTLADRTRARQLNNNEEIARFVENLELAATAMEPASQHLEAIELEQAIQPEQEALQHLLRAEAVFTDMQVSFQQGQGGGGSPRAGQDLAEMFELEMDLKKNQYETGNPASPEAQTQETDDAMDQLEELARRQEQLANNMRQQNNITEAQRWQQEMLRREAEELRERLERMDRTAQNDQQGQQGQGQQSGSSSASGGQQAGSTAQGNGQQQGQAGSETGRRLESAIRAMDEIAEAMNNPAERQRLERAAGEAQRQLQGARDEVARNQQRAMEESFGSMAGQASDLYEQQRQMEQDLQQAVRRALAQRQQGGEVTSGLTPEEEARLARGKKAMAEQLQALEQAIHNSTEQFKQSMPEAISELEQAQDVISKSQLQERLYVASEYIAYGAAPYIAGSESAVTQALSEISDRLRRAQGAAEGTELADAGKLEQTLTQTRSLRRELERLAQEGQSPGDQAQAGEEGQQAGPGREQTSGRAGAGIGDPWSGYGGRNRIGIDPGAWDRIGRDLDDTARAIRDAMPELRDQDLSLEEINEIRNLAQQLQQQFIYPDNGRNEGIIEQEYLSALALLEQLELRLDAGVRSNEPARVRSSAAEPVASEYEDAVAEYYRRLSREE